MSLNDLIVAVLTWLDARDWRAIAQYFVTTVPAFGGGVLFGYWRGRSREWETWRAAWLASRLAAGNLRRRPDPQPTREAAVAALDDLWERRERGETPRPDKVL